ncbi:hypothetical protein PVAP13_1KG250500 [Panicum virgatum]|uniref:BSD domain-containing protein n=1 Tax=Panicum virgatum TaxID=38727 RepID=A0A8T0X9N8_PANVG|nr:hypothetical protein PVAP13_1KG250500 [Panicum virgatum]
MPSLPCLTPALAAGERRGLGRCRREGHQGGGCIRVGCHPAEQALARLPPPTDDVDSDDFDMTEAQQDHTLAVKSLAPELVDLRIELCPSRTSEGCFLKIYFVLLHPIAPENRWYGWR